MNQPGNRAIRTNRANSEGFFFKIIWASCLDQVGRNQPGTNRANATNRVTGYPTGDGSFLVARLAAQQALTEEDRLVMFAFIRTNKKLPYIGQFRHA